MYFLNLVTVAGGGPTVKDEMRQKGSRRTRRQASSSVSQARADQLPMIEEYCSRLFRRFNALMVPCPRSRRAWRRYVERLEAPTGRRQWLSRWRTRTSSPIRPTSSRQEGHGHAPRAPGHLRANDWAHRGHAKSAYLDAFASVNVRRRPAHGSRYQAGGLGDVDLEATTGRCPRCSSGSLGHEVALGRDRSTCARSCEQVRAKPWPLAVVRRAMQLDADAGLVGALLTATRPCRPATVSGLVGVASGPRRGLGAPDIGAPREDLLDGGRFWLGRGR